ncbi:glycosyltransferase, partial [Priestia aryabhattai]|uniref:glycosyltransferase n=1 Tax=Priestia aryabhattai TaxID=412384 RepID=UPI002E1DC426
MKIVIDLTIVRETNKITGIERVAIETLKSLLTNRYANFKYHIICSKKGYVYIKRIIESIVQSPNDIEVFQSPFENRIITDQIWMPNIIKKISPDYVYYTTLGVPFLQRFPFSIIVHDVVAWVMPDTISKGMKYYYKPLIEKALKNKKNTNIVTVSSFSKKSIVEELGVKEDKIVVNYLGISSNFIEKENTYNPNEVLGEYGISKEYIIALGTIEPRKNIEGAIKAFAIMKEKYNYKGQLVIVGREGWIKNFNISESIASEIVITGFVSDQDLPIILSQSKA